MTAAVVFDDVSKKFRKGERHNSLRDLVPSIATSLFRRRDPQQLGAQEFWALKHVSFEVEPGQALGIIGANGAGKSTSLKVLTRILRPTSGRVRVTGRIGALIEVAAGFHPDLTGRENIFMQGAIMGMKRADIARRFDEIVEFAGVGEFVDTQVKRYSSGMNARLGFSIAAHLDPEVLIIDEVLAVGDMAFQQKCYDRMEYFKRRGVAIVLVSHNLQAVATLCDQTLVLARSVLFSGRTTEAIAAYLGASQPAPADRSGDAVEIVDARLTDHRGHPLADHNALPPGAALRLTVHYRSRVALDDVTFGLHVRRTSDDLLIFNGHINRREVSASPLEGEFRLQMDFVAHLARGHYYLALHVLHNPNQEHFAPWRHVMGFGVNEVRTGSGIADVELDVRLLESDRPRALQGSV